jgi:hypothetical protein
MALVMCPDNVALHRYNEGLGGTLMALCPHMAALSLHKMTLVMT